MPQDHVAITAVYVMCLRNMSHKLQGIWVPQDPVAISAIYVAGFMTMFRSVIHCS